MKVGMVLEGGAMRGMFTAGVLDTLMDEKIEVDGIMGVSAGAVFGPNYFSNQKKRALRYNLKYAKDKRYISLRNLILTGNAVSKKFAYYDLQRKYDVFDNDTFMKTGKPFWAVATNVKTGCPEYFEIKDATKDMEALRASSAIPLSSRIIKIDKNKYLDGGISDAIPVLKMQEYGFDKLIVILTQPLKYHKKAVDKKKLRLIKLKYRHYKNFINAVINWPKKYNETLDLIMNLEKDNKIFVIRPSMKIKVKMPERDTEKLQSIYDMGVADCKKVLDDLKKYLAK